MYPVYPPQVLSLDTFAAGLGDDDVPHFPKPDWHPVPQCAEVEPQLPCTEQQFPKLLPRQVRPVSAPQRADVLTLRARIDGMAERAHRSDERIVAYSSD